MPDLPAALASLYMIHLAMTNNLTNFRVLSVRLRRRFAFRYIAVAKVVKGNAIENIIYAVCHSSPNSASHAPTSLVARLLCRLCALKQAVYQGYGAFHSSDDIPNGYLGGIAGQKVAPLCSTQAAYDASLFQRHHQLFKIIFR